MIELTFSVCQFANFAASALFLNITCKLIVEFEVFTNLFYNGATLIMLMYYLRLIKAQCVLMSFKIHVFK